MQPTRRQIIELTSALAALGITPILPAASPHPLPRRSRTQRNRTLVVVFLRGGIDGLNLIVPHGDPGYYAARNSIAVRRPGQANGAIDLDGMFGLHPWAEPLKKHFDTGSMVALNAVGHGKNTRSHFEEEDVWETAMLESSVHSQGWLNRHLQLSEGHGPVRAVAIGDALPRILRGASPALALRGLDDLALGDDSSFDATARALRKAYGSSSDEARSGARGLLDAGGDATLDALRVLREATSRTAESRVSYPGQAFPRRMREVARLIRSDVGLELAVVDFGGWDTHQNQGGVGGSYSQRVRQLAGGLDAFARDLDEGMEDVLVVTLSEFGRTAFQNGTGGTDHGWGNCLLAMGGSVQNVSATPRRVLGQWPGLQRDQLHQGRDLMHTTDFRDVFAELLLHHLGSPDLERLLPGHQPRPVGLLKS